MMISKGILYFDMWLVITPDLFSDSSLLAGTEKQLKWCLFLNMHLFLVANTGRERCCSLKAELYKESDKNRIAYDE